MTAAQLLVRCLEAHGVKFVFGIPGAKVDAVFDALMDSKIRLIVCRHEQNAAFMAAAYGRLTGSPGVVLVTSGPGVANLATGLLTATTEGDPVIALGGNVARSMQLRASHQNTQNAKLMEAVTKLSVEVNTASALPETLENAFRIATEFKRGACFISLPQDVLAETTALSVPAPLPHPPLNAAALPAITQVAQLINKARCPVVLLGEEASVAGNTKAIRDWLSKAALPVVSTFQAAGVISRQLQHCFYGRVGLFKNQPGDQLLDQADVVITVGFNSAEYDPEIWNAQAGKTLVHLDYRPASLRGCYRPTYELVGDIAQTVQALSAQLSPRSDLHSLASVQKLQQQMLATIESGKTRSGPKVHPLRFIYELRHLLDDSALVMCDVGSVYMWMARYFLSYEPHHLLFSNGQQTLGVALPWAMAARLVYPGKPIVSISGDGGFLFSGVELETAVREKLKLIHCIWTDGTYNMVLEQQVMKYKRKSGVDLGKVDWVKYAEAFGAKGFAVRSSEELSKVLQHALTVEGPVLIDIPIDYSDNPGLFTHIDPNAGH